MKKILYFAVAAFAFVACAKEMTPEKEEVKETPKVKVSIKAVLAQEPETKATIDMSDGSGSWEKDDEIAVFTHKGDTVILKAETAGASVTFSGEIDEGDAIDDNAVAYYPASIAIPGADNVNKVNLPNSYGSAAAAAKGFLLRGVLTGEEGKEIVFKHIGALLKVSINDVPSDVTALEFSAASKAIIGQLDVIQEGENPFYCAAGAGSNDNRTITIATTSAERTSSATVFCIPMPVGTYTNGFSIILKAGSTVAATKTSTNNVTISRAKVVKMKAFTPEEASGWFVAGGFNRWSTTATAMTAVEGHDGWLVAKNIDVTPVDGQSAGFKFYNGAWKGSNGAGLHTQYDGADEANSSNITPANGKYDIYFNPGTNKYFIANAGEPWIYKTIHLMTDMVLDNLTYYLHIWPHSGAGLTTEWPGIQGSTETISEILYYKFEVAICDGDFTSNSYDCIFSDGETDEGETQNHKIRYDFRDGAITANSTDANYYASFSGSSYNKGEKNYTYGDGKTNPMTQFTDPSQPQGTSNWYLLKYEDKTSWDSSSSNLSYNRMVWDNGPVLVYKDILINSSTGLTFRYTNGHSNTFYYYSGAVTDTYFDLTFNANKDRSSVPMISTSLDGDYYCDVYLDIINGKAKIVPIAKTSTPIYVRINGRDVEHAYLYAWYGSNTEVLGGFPGTEMTTEVINGETCYKVNVPTGTIWNHSVNLIVSDGNHSGHWQTSNFTTADWSGRKDAYFFSVVGNTITQTSVSDISYNYSSGFDGVNWSNSDWQISADPEYVVAWKSAYDATNVYFYFLLNASKNSADSYIYSAYDTNGNSGTGSDTNAFTGDYEAQSCFYPFKEQGGVLVCREGEDNKNWIQCPVVKNTYSGQYAPVVHGVIKGDYDHVEMKVPKVAIGSPANSTIDVNHSWQWHDVGSKTITISN